MTDAPLMEPDEEINRFKSACGDHFKSKGLEVHVDVSISDVVRWRPHLFVQNASKMVLDIVDTEQLSELQVQKYIEIMNILPEMEVFVVLIGKAEYLPELFCDCNKYGIGVFVIKDNLPKLVLQSKPREVETLAGAEHIAIVPGTPFGNALSLKKCLRKFRGYLKWFERNLPRNSIELLYESIKHEDLKGLESIKLLRGVDDKLTKSFRDDFENFQEEVASLEIAAEMRIILDGETTREIHGRYMYSIDDKGGEIRIQLPPLNSLRGDQWDTIFTDMEIIPRFDDYWAKGVDILSDWPSVEKSVNDHLKHKAEEARVLLEKVA